MSRTRERLREAVGTNGQLLVNVIPSLELLIGEQPAVELDLGMSEMQNLYNQLFTRLIDVFSRYMLLFSLSATHTRRTTNVHTASSQDSR